MKGYRGVMWVALLAVGLLIATMLTVINVQVSNMRMETLRQIDGGSAGGPPGQGQDGVVATPTETIPPNTPLPSLTPVPTVTLRPPPTLEPPTLTPRPTATPTITTEPTLAVDLTNPGIIGLATDTPTPDEACEPRQDWTLRHEVQPQEALANIAAQYGTTAPILAEANCLDNPDLIRVGQQLRVPGEAPPDPNAVECVPWEVLTPINGAFAVDGGGQITFNWRGPRASRNLLRIWDEDGEQVHEAIVDLAQNITINAPNALPDGEGVFYWTVYPLGMDFQQIDCRESPRWQFHKTEFEPTEAPAAPAGP